MTCADRLRPNFTVQPKNGFFAQPKRLGMRLTSQVLR
jgi:hypothetical protein